MFVQNNHIRENIHTYIHTCNLLSVTKGILVVKAFLMNFINVFCSVFASIG